MNRLDKVVFKQDGVGQKLFVHLSAVPDNRSSTVAKFALAVPGVVVAEQEVVLSRQKHNHDHQNCKQNLHLYYSHLGK